MSNVASVKCHICKMTHVKCRTGQNLKLSNVTFVKRCICKMSSNCQTVKWRICQNSNLSNVANVKILICQKKLIEFSLQNVIIFMKTLFKCFIDFLIKRKTSNLLFFNRKLYFHCKLNIL